MGQKTGYCSRCGRKIVGSSHKVGSESLCGDCYRIEMQSLKALEKSKTELYDYFKALFGKVSCPDPVKNAIDRSLSNGMKLPGIRFTVYYYYEIKGNVPENINELPWVIRDYYDEARDYAASMKKLGDENRKVSIDTTPSVVKIKKPARKKKLAKKISWEEE